MKYRKIKCPPPLPSGFKFRASNPITGEVFDSNDLAPILRVVAENYGYNSGWWEQEWKIEIVT